MCTNLNFLAAADTNNIQKKDFNDNSILTRKIGNFIPKHKTQYHQFFTQKTAHQKIHIV